MKPITDIYPDPSQECFYAPGYGDIVRTFEHEILLESHDNDYQGDSRYLLRDNDTGAYGYLNFGWGSCSGCDALQACGSVAEVERFRDGLHASIQWRPSAAELLDFMRKRDWPTQYEWASDETKQFVADAITLLEGLTK
jgi:hypothetical protein